MDPNKNYDSADDRPTETKKWRLGPEQLAVEVGAGGRRMGTRLEGTRLTPGQATSVESIGGHGRITSKHAPPSMLAHQRIATPLHSWEGDDGCSSLGGAIGSSSSSSPLGSRNIGGVTRAYQELVDDGRGVDTGAGNNNMGIGAAGELIHRNVGDSDSPSYKELEDITTLPKLPTTPEQLAVEVGAGIRRMGTGLERTKLLPGQATSVESIGGGHGCITSKHAPSSMLAHQKIATPLHSGEGVVGRSNLGGAIGSSSSSSTTEKKYISLGEVDAGARRSLGRGGRERGGRGGQSSVRAQHQPPPPRPTTEKLGPISPLAPAQFAVEVWGRGPRVLAGFGATRLVLGQGNGVELNGGGHDLISSSKQASSTSMEPSDGSKKRRSRARVNGRHVRGRSRGRAQPPPPPRPTIEKLTPEHLAVEVGAGGSRMGTAMEGTRLTPGQATSVESIGGGHGRITSKHAPPSMLAHQRIATPLHSGEGVVGRSNLGGAIGSSSSSSSLTKKKKYRSLGEVDAGASRSHGRGGHERGGRGGQSPGRAQHQPPPSRPTTGKLGPISPLAPAQFAVEVWGRGLKMGAGFGATRLVLGQGTGVEFNGCGHDHISSSKEASSTSKTPSDGSKKRRSGERVNGRHVRGRSRDRAQRPPPPKPTIEKLTPEQLGVEVGAVRRRMGTGMEGTRLTPGQGTSVESIGGGHGSITSKHAPASMLAHQRIATPLHRGEGVVGRSNLGGAIGSSSSSSSSSLTKKKYRSLGEVDAGASRSHGRGGHERGGRGGQSPGRAQYQPPPLRPTTGKLGPISPLAPAQFAVEVWGCGLRMGAGFGATRLVLGQGTGVEFNGCGHDHISSSKEASSTSTAPSDGSKKRRSGERVYGRHVRGRSRDRAQPPPPPRLTIEKLTPEQVAVEVGAGGMGTGMEGTRLTPGQATSGESIGGGHGRITSKHAPPSMLAHQRIATPLHSWEGDDGCSSLGGAIGSSSSSSPLGSRNIGGVTRAYQELVDDGRGVDTGAGNNNMGIGAAGELIHRNVGDSDSPSYKELEDITTLPKWPKAPEQLAVEVGAGIRSMGTGLERTRLLPEQATSVESIGGGHGRITSKHAPPSMLAHQKIATPLHSGEGVVGRSNLGGAIGSSSSSSPTEKNYRSLGELDTGACRRHGRGGRGGQSPGRAQRQPPPRRPTTGQLRPISVLAPAQLAVEAGGRGQRMGAGFGATRLVLGQGTGVEFNGCGHDLISSSKEASSTSTAPSDGSKKRRSGERVDVRHVRGRSRGRAQPPPPPRPTIEKLTPEQLAVEVGAGLRRIGTGLEGTRLTPGQATSVESIGGGYGRITSRHALSSMLAHQRIATPLHSGEGVVGRSNLGSAIGSSLSAPLGSSNIGGVTRSYQELVLDGRGVDTGAGNNNMGIGAAGELNHRNAGDSDSPIYKDLEDITTLPKLPTTPENLAVEVGAGGRRWVQDGMNKTDAWTIHQRRVNWSGHGCLTSKQSPPSMLAHQRIATPLHSWEGVDGRSNLGSVIGSSSSSTPLGSSNIGGVTRSYQVLVDDGKGVETGGWSNNMGIGTAGELNHWNVGDSVSPSYKDLEDIMTLPKLPPSNPAR